MGDFLSSLLSSLFWCNSISGTWSQSVTVSYFHSASPLVYKRYLDMHFNRFWHMTTVLKGRGVCHWGKRYFETRWTSWTKGMEFHIFAYGNGRAMGCMIKKSYIKMTFNSMSQIVIVELLGWAICIKRFLKKPLPPFGQRLRLRLRRHISSSLFSHGTNKREWWFLKRCKDCKHCPASLPFVGSL